MLMSVLVREIIYPAQKVSILSSKFLNLGGLVLLECLPAQKNTVHLVKQDWGLLYSYLRCVESCES